MRELLKPDDDSSLDDERLPSIGGAKDFSAEFKRPSINDNCMLDPASDLINPENISKISDKSNNSIKKKQKNNVTADFSSGKR